MADSVLPVLIHYLITLIVFMMGACAIFYQHKKLTVIKRKTDDLYHDINSSLIIVQLTLESLKELTMEDIGDSSQHASLISALEEGTTQIEGSFCHWDVEKERK
jgi:hypothetical protein